MTISFLNAPGAVIVRPMTHDSRDIPSRTHSSLIEGLAAGDSAKWALFCETYTPLLTRYAAARLRGGRGGDVDDVVQSVFTTFLHQRHNARFSYQTGQGRFRDYLKTCVRNEAIAYSRRRKPYVSIDAEAGVDPADEAQVDSEFVADYFLTILGKTTAEIRAHCLIGNPTKWQCFVERVLHRRPVPDVASELRVEPALVYKNVARVLDEIFQTCRKQYLADFGEDGLATLLARVGPKVMEELSGHVLALEAAGPVAPERAAIDYFQGVLRARMPAFQADAIQASPATWAAFRQFTRAIHERADPGRPEPAVGRLLDKIDRLLLDHSVADLGDRTHYRTLKTLSHDAIAMLCGTPGPEERPDEPA